MLFSHQKTQHKLHAHCIQSWGITWVADRYLIKSNQWILLLGTAIGYIYQISGKKIIEAPLKSIYVQSIRIRVLFIKYLGHHLEKFIQLINSACFIKSPLCTIVRTWMVHALTSTVPLVNTLLAANRTFVTFGKDDRGHHGSALADCTPERIDHHLFDTKQYFRHPWNFKEASNVSLDGLNIISNLINTIPPPFG